MSEREVLPTDIRPVNYNLTLTDVDFGQFTYNGVVVIDYKCNKATDQVVLNYRSGMTVQKASVQQGNKNINVKEITFDEQTERVNFQLEAQIDGDAKVTVQFNGRIQDNMAGFYRSRYQVDGEDKVMASTQFESTDARRAFPCADEPNLKASFEFTIEVPSNFTALSNMPVKNEAKVNDKVTRIEFEKSPEMSTYLYAWAVGEFEYIEASTEKEYNGKKLPVRVYTTKGLKEQGRLALQSATKILDYYSEVFGIDYVLPKCDLLAVHAFTHGAMENWGLITYRTTAVLFDEETSDPMYKNRVVYVVAHELAHQWFGNLVTMDWWDELWLNEGFATWVGWFAVDHLYPEWDVFSKFVSDALQQALKLDALRGSHPIEVPVRSGAEIDQIFDSISYLKGASCIRMLSTHLGVDTFLKGVAKYLARHQFGNAKTTDLWAAVGEVAGVDVASIMQHWTKNIGFPVLTVTETESDVKVRQDRFLSTGDVGASENNTEWWVPLSISSGADSVDNKSLESRDTELNGLAAQDCFKFNKDTVGVYRVNYSEDRLGKIGAHVDQLTVRDKIGLVGDAGATASAGIGSTAGLLKLIKKIAESGERSYFVWYEMVMWVRGIRAAFSNDESLRNRLDKFFSKLVEPLLNEFKWETETNDYVWIQFRALIFGLALDLGITSVVDEARTRFNQALSGDTSALHPSLKKDAMCSVAANATGDDLQKAYEHIKKEMAVSATVDGREQAAIAAGRVQNPDLITKSLNSFLSGEVLAQDAHSLINSLAANRTSRSTTWDFVKSHWNDILTKYGSNLIIFERIVRLLVSNFSTKKEYDDVVEFFNGKDLTGYDRGISQAQDIIKVRYQWADKDTGAVEGFLTSVGF